MSALRGLKGLVLLTALTVAVLAATTVFSQHMSFTRDAQPMARGSSGVVFVPSDPVPLLREDDPLPGAAPGEIVSSLNNPVVNHAGGFALTVNTTGSGTTLSNVWGNATGGPGTVIITEGTYGDLTQTSFESFHGVSDDGTPSYSASSTNNVTGVTGLDGAWLLDTVVLNEDDPVPSLPGQFSTFNSRPGVTADGLPYWVGGIADSPKVSTQNRVLFFGFGATPILMGGDTIDGVSEPIETGSSNLDFDYRFSALGSNYLTQVLVDTGSSSNDGVVTSNGAAVFRGGGILREAEPVPELVGGLVGENWDNFDFFGITEGGLILVTGDTDGDTSMDEFVLLGEGIILREGTVLTTPEGMFTLDGAIEGGYLNEDGDWTVIWDVDDAMANNLEALLLNGQLLLKEGDPIDVDGDGLPDPGATLANFTGISTLVLSDRDDQGFVSVYFTADVDTEGTSGSSDDIEVLYRQDVQVAEIIIPPDDEDEDEDDDSDDDGDDESGDDSGGGSAGSQQIDSGSMLDGSFSSLSGRSDDDSGSTSTQSASHIPQLQVKRPERRSGRTDLVQVHQIHAPAAGESDFTAQRRELERLVEEAEKSGDEEALERAENRLRRLIHNDAE